MAIDLDTLQEKPKHREEDWNDLFEAKGQDPSPRFNYACVDLSTNLSWTVYQLELYLYVWEFCNCQMIIMTDPKND